MNDTLLGWHGTASLEAILETGLDPFPEDKIWDGEDDPSLESAGGIYFGETASAAAAFALDAQDQTLDAPGIVLVQLQAGDVVADEDRIRIAVRPAISGTPFDPEGDLSWRGDTQGLDRLEDYRAGTPDPEIEQIITAVSGRLGASPDDHELIAGWLHAWHAHLYDVTADSRDAHFEALNTLCSRLPHTARRDWVYQNSTYHSFRCLKPIGFDGPSRILAVGRMRERNRGLTWGGLEPLYGSFPEGTEAAVRDGWRQGLDKRGLTEVAA